MELLLNRKTQLDVTCYFVLWRGHMSAEWLLAEELLHRQGKVAEYEAGPAARLEHAGAIAPPPLPRCWLQPVSGWPGGGASGRGGTGGCTSAVPLAPRGLGGGAGSPSRRVCRRTGFSHVVGYASASLLGPGAGAVNTLLDAASRHGPAGRWHLLVPTGLPAGPAMRRVGV